MSYLRSNQLADLLANVVFAGRNASGDAASLCDLIIRDNAVHEQITIVVDPKVGEPEVLSNYLFQLTGNGNVQEAMAILEERNKRPTFFLHDEESIDELLPRVRCAVEHNSKIALYVNYPEATRFGYKLRTGRLNFLVEPISELAVHADRINIVI